MQLASWKTQEGGGGQQTEIFARKQGEAYINLFFLEHTAAGIVIC